MTPDVTAPEVNTEVMRETVDYVCIDCRINLTHGAEQLVCGQCQTTFSVIEGIPVFAKRRGYWCNVAKDKMHLMIKDAEASGDWLAAVNKHIESYAPHIVPMYRADAQFAFPINSQSRVLDAGSMWGGLTIPIAQFAGSVYALDQTWETLRFLKTRAQQMGLDNITLVESSIHKLPFPDGYFDFVLLNGVLEWLGVEQDVVLEKHWQHKRDDEHEYQATPRDMQLAALKEIFRVTKPGGGLYVAIENRIGLQYFLGHPDDHVNVRFVPFLPRFLANKITKMCRNSAYRTYIYSPKKLQALVDEAGFNSQTLYSVYPHYGKISRMVPMRCFSAFRRMAKQGYAHIKIFCLSAAWRLIPEPLSKFMAPSIALLAAKGEFTLPQRLLGLLMSQQLIEPEQVQRYELILTNNRFGNGHTSNYIVYDKENKKSIYFCKISRVRQAQALAHESKQLRAVQPYITGSTLEGTIPNLLFFGVVDGITVQVASYVDAQPIVTNFFNALRSAPRFIKTKNKLICPFVAMLQRYGRKRWLRHIDPYMKKAICWLAEFQVATQQSIMGVDEIIDNWVPQQLEAIRKQGINLANEDSIDRLLQELQSYKDTKVSLVAQHGDFDVCNVLKKQSEIFIVDFEHTEFNKLPFFDLANLIFSPLISEWKSTAIDISLTQYIHTSGWKVYLDNWLATYAAKTNMTVEFVKLAMRLAVLEQNAKKYPHTRDPYDYPMYGQDSLEALLSIEL